MCVHLIYYLYICLTIRLEYLSSYIVVAYLAFTGVALLFV